MDALKAELNKLSAERAALEADINQRTARLNGGPGQPGMHESLVDKEVCACCRMRALIQNIMLSLPTHTYRCSHTPPRPRLLCSPHTQGFPRADIDVHAVRLDRNAVIRLTNDHKALSQQMEQLLHKLHALARWAFVVTWQQQLSMPTACRGHTRVPYACVILNVSICMQFSYLKTHRDAGLTSLGGGNSSSGGAGGGNAAATTSSAAAAANGQQEQHEDKRPRLDAAAAATTTSQAAGESGGSVAAPLRPFAVVDEIADGSPAATAGIQLGDQLCK